MTDNLDWTEGSGKTIATDDVSGVHFQKVKLVDGTADSATVIAAGGGVEAAALRVTLASDSTGVVSIDDNAASLTVDQGTAANLKTEPAGNVAHDAGDSGNPIKVGAMAVNALPAAVANLDRANNLSDLFGRQLIAHIDPAMQVWKSANYTTQQTGATIWDPTAGKKIAITSVVVGSYGTTAGRFILWFGANGDTTYSAGTDQLLLAASYAPSTTSKPGTVFTPTFPVFCVTADMELHITTDAALSVDVAVYGYEF